MIDCWGWDEKKGFDSNFLEQAENCYLNGFQVEVVCMKHDMSELVNNSLLCRQLIHVEL